MAYFSRGIIYNAPLTFPKKKKKNFHLRKAHMDKTAKESFANRFINTLKCHPYAPRCPCNIAWFFFFIIKWFNWVCVVTSYWLWYCKLCEVFKPIFLMRSTRSFICSFLLHVLYIISFSYVLIKLIFVFCIELLCAFHLFILLKWEPHY